MGKACESVRKKECPDVEPTVFEVMRNMDDYELSKFLARIFLHNMCSDKILEWGTSNASEVLDE